MKSEAWLYGYMGQHFVAVRSNSIVAHVLTQRRRAAPLFGHCTALVCSHQLTDGSKLHIIICNLVYDCNDHDCLVK